MTILSTDCHFLKDQRSQGHGSYDIILCLSSEISPFLPGEFYLAILIWVSDHFWLISPNLFLPQTSYPTNFTPTYSPFSQQWSVSSIIKKVIYQLWFLLPSFPQFTNTSTSSLMLSSFALCKKHILLLLSKASTAFKPLDLSPPNL